LSIQRSTDAAAGNANKNVPFYLGQPVQLGATVNDTDAACGIPQQITYAWSLAAQPAGSSAQILNPGAQNPSFIPDIQGEYDVKLVLTDQSGRSTTTMLTKTTANAVAISAGNCGGQAPVAKIQVTGPVA